VTRRLLFITHADVVIDPDRPVPDWGLSERGIARHRAFAEMPVCDGLTRVISSDERKARDGAEILAQARGLPCHVLPDLHENDRSATGYLPRDEFEQVADAFFAMPDHSVRGWERAVDAQARIVRAVETAVQQFPTGDLAIVSHGGVGALLMCHLAGAPVSRAWDQPGQGGGNYFCISLPDRRIVQGWTDIAGPQI
jgi:broad specificity phosphatase PhoE